MFPEKARFAEVQVACGVRVSIGRAAQSLWRANLARRVCGSAQDRGGAVVSHGKCRPGRRPPSRIIGAAGAMRVTIDESSDRTLVAHDLAVGGLRGCAGVSPDTLSIPACVADSARRRAVCMSWALLAALRETPPVPPAKSTPDRPNMGRVQMRYPSRRGPSSVLLRFTACFRRPSAGCFGRMGSQREASERLPNSGRSVGTPTIEEHAGAAQHGFGVQSCSPSWCGPLPIVLR